MSRLFGTNGIRGVIGKTLTPELALRLGRALGSGLEVGTTVALGRDARTSSPMILGALAAGLHSAGINTLDHGILPTPAFQFAVKNGSFGAGAIVTASHNPPEYNGIKLMAPDGTEASAEQEEQVEKIHFSNRFRTAAWDKVGQPSEESGAIQRYLDAIVKQVDAKAIAKAKLSVVLDAGGGSGGPAGVKLLKSLGVTTTKLSCSYDGAFSDRASEPIEANATACKEKVTQVEADLGVLLDGDADRAVFITEQGTYCWGDTSLAILAREELDRSRGGACCAPVSTSTAVEDVVRRARGEMVWTPVGSPIVAREMIARQAPIGGEDNGGIILARHQYCRDALMAVAFMLETLAKSKRSMSELVAEVPKYSLWKDKVMVPDDRKDSVMERAKTEIPAWEGVKSTDTRDGVKAYFEGGWVLVRPSGTEPIVRVQAEGNTKEQAAELGQKVKAWLQQTRGPLVVI